MLQGIDLILLKPVALSIVLISPFLYLTKKNVSGIKAKLNRDVPACWEMISCTH